VPLCLSAVVALTLVSCDRTSKSQPATSQQDEPASSTPAPAFRNVVTRTEYVGDAPCAGCHVRETSAYKQHPMATSFHKWTRANRIETPLDTSLFHAPTGLRYSVVDDGTHLWQVEFLTGAGGKRLNELRRRVDYVMGSGHVALTYFTEENGRLFQLPLTWYREYGWDFSPGYQINNGRFDRLMPDRCISCHSSYPKPIQFLEGKYAEVRPGIGCERCHGPGALHVAERKAGTPRDGAFDKSIVNPARLPLERRLDVCEQCHVHTPVTVLREGNDNFSYIPSQPLRDFAAFFKVSGGIDIVSHADRLRQSACFIATRNTARPLECATCHDPHQPPPDRQTRNQPCLSCHAAVVLQQRLTRSASVADHTPTADCSSCHMPRVQVRPVLHGTFTDHWIRVTTRATPRPAPTQGFVGRPIQAYFARDQAGPVAAVYQRLGEIVYANRANNGRLLGEAAGLLDRALDKDTTFGEAHFLLGVAYQQMGRTDDAIRALEQSVRIDSNHPDRLRALASSYERAGRAPAEIDRLYQRALALQPALAWIRADYANFLQSLGQSAAAEKAYRAALAEQPSLASVWFNLGTLLTEENRQREASSAFREAVHLDPALAQALAPLLEIRTTGKIVSGVRTLQSPLLSLPVRDRGPRAARLTIATEMGKTGVEFVNVPAPGVIQILRPDGTLVRAMRSGDDGTLVWDMLTAAGNPIAGGLYSARVIGGANDATGRPPAPQVIYFGIARRVE